MSVRAVLGTTASLAVGFAAFVSLVRPHTWGMWAADAGTLRLIAGFVATVVGAMSGAAYRRLARLKERRIQTIPRGAISTAFRSVDLWMGLVASPVVYGLLLQSAETLATTAVIAIGLENGFCCQLLVDRLTPHAPPQTPTRSPDGSAEGG